MFRGRHNHAIDAKGRLSIPSQFRDLLSARCEEVLVVTNDDLCLAAYPLAEWLILEEQIRKLPPLHPDTRKLIRYFVSAAAECRLDRQGRILIPTSLREFAGIEKDAVVVGHLNRIEIWDPLKWEAELGAAGGDTFASITSRLHELSK